MGQSLSQCSDISDDKLDAFSLIWLDAEVDNTKENQENKKKLEESIRHLKTFTDTDECGQYINSAPADDRIILIVSGRLGRSFVPSIHSCRSVVSIYVYCRDLESNEKWAAQYIKIRHVAIDWNELIHLIKFDHEIQVYDRMCGPLPISIFDPALNHEKLTVDLRDKLIQSQLIINGLLSNESRTDDRQQLIAFSKKIYRNNSDELRMIEKFADQYSMEEALKWYTRDSFLSQLLNKALRTQNIDVLILFHFFIDDIRNRLTALKQREKIKAYRRLLLSKNRIEKLRSAVGKFISINSFLSAYMIKPQALSYASYDSHLEEVLIEINADPMFAKNKPFASIGQYNADKKDEVLFMLGSIFEIKRMEHEDNNTWLLQLKLYPDSSESLHSLSNDTEKLLSFGHVLETIGNLEEARSLYRSLCDTVPEKDPNSARCYEALASVTDEKGDYDSSLGFYLKALERNKASNQQPLLIASNYNDIGEVYRKKKQYEDALKNHETALKVLQKADTRKNLAKQAVCYNSMGIVYQSQENYRKALDYYMKAFSIRKEHYPLDEISLGMSCNNIGNAHYYLGQPKDAEFHYGEALKYYKKKLPQNHPKIASTYNNFGALYEDQNKLEEALCYYKDALNTYQGIYSNKHPYVKKIWENIQAVKKRMGK